MGGATMSFVEAYHEAIHQWKPTIQWKRAFLDLLNNSMPYSSPDGNLQVGFLDRERDLATKWRSWWEVRDNDWWVERINQRLIGLPEVVLDLDPDPNTFQIITKQKISGCKVLGTYNTGSRGHHCHLLRPDLLARPRAERETWKRLLMERANADLQKATDRTMIALEMSPHWKTGKCKKLS